MPLLLSSTKSFGSFLFVVATTRRARLSAFGLLFQLLAKFPPQGGREKNLFRRRLAAKLFAHARQS